ncbi:hypothetical protein PybrP1_012363 [[Pythium] brassicae (nom. inval.)]|nr:hypothetical protein PybrP1_012363 [[Pythium] brassicae (nom. inval.)]
MVKWNIGTFARLRPPRRGHDCAKFMLDKIDDGRQSAAVIAFPPPDDDDERLHMKQREALQFRFSDIFDPSVSQEQVFNRACLHYADRGIIPRVLSTIFEEFEQRANVRYACYISYLEIYNESVYDLLDRSHTDRPIEEWTKVLLMDDDEGEMHFRNLGVYEAISEEEALNLLFLGNMNRVTSDTPMNQASSRSHSIFTVMIEARPVSVDIAVNSEIDSEKRIEALEKANSAFEHANFELQAKVVQLESELRASKELVRKQQQQWELEVQHVRAEAQRQLAAAAEAAAARSKARAGPVDWTKCEEIVERLLLTGDLPREELETQPDDCDDDDAERSDARRLHQQVVEEIRDGGIACAVGCLLAMKDNIFFASNTAVELQEMVNKQSETVELLERRLLEQKRAGELMKLQIQQLTEQSRQSSALESSMMSASGSATTSIPRSNSSSSYLHGFGDDSSKSDSDSDKDSEMTADSHRENQHRRQQMTQQRSSTKASTSAALSGQQSTVALVIAPLGAAGEPGSRAHKSSEKEQSAAESSRHRSSHDERDINGSSRASKGDAIRDAEASEARANGSRGSNGKASQPTALPSGSDVIRRRMELLKNGSLFVKYGRFGKPHVRFVWCSSDLEYLNYRTVSKPIPKASIPTRSISRVHLGQATKVFERAREEMREPFCFSIEYDDSRTLDLEIADGDSVELKVQKRSEWVEALQFLVKLKSVQSKKTSLAPAQPAALASSSPQS